MRLSNRLRSFGLMAALATQLLASAIAQVACVNFEVKQTNPVHLSQHPPVRGQHAQHAGRPLSVFDGLRLISDDTRIRQWGGVRLL